MVHCPAVGDGAEGSVVIIALVEGTSAAMGIVVVVSAAAGAKGAGEARAEAGEVVETGEVVWLFGVGGVEETEGAEDTWEAEETGEAKVLVGAVGEVEAVGARGAGEAMEVGDAVDAGGIVRAGIVFWGDVAGARKLNVVKASADAILAVIEPFSFPYLTGRGSRMLRPSFAIALLQSRLGSACSNISVFSYSTIVPRSVTTLQMWS